MRLLHRLGIGPGAVEAYIFAVVAGFLLGPECLHRLQHLPQIGPALVELDAVIVHLLHVPAGADPEQEAAAGNQVDRRDLLGEGDRIVLVDQADRGTDQDLFGDGGRGGAGGERVGHMHIFAQQFPAAGVGRLAFRRNMGVLGEPDGFVAPGLRRPGEAVRQNAVFGIETEQAECHEFLPTASGSRPGSRPASSRCPCTGRECSRWPGAA